MSQAENKESQLEIIDKKTDEFLKTLLNIKENNKEYTESVIIGDDHDNDNDEYIDNNSNENDTVVSSLTDNTPLVFKDTIGKIFPSFKEKDYKLIKQKVDKLSELIKEKTPEENLKKEIKKLIITILQLNNESNIIDAYEPLFTKNLIVSTDIKDSEYILDIQDDSKKVIGISGVLNKDFIGKLKYLDEFIQLKDKKEENVKKIIEAVGNTSIKDLKDLLESQNKAKEEAKKKAEEEQKQGGRRTFKRKRKTRINKKNKRKTNKSKQNKK